MRLALIAALLLVAPAAARADGPPAPAYQPKKDRARATKSTRHGAPPVPGTKPAKLINLYNQHTHDWLGVDPLAPPSLGEINIFLRDHFTNESTKMDPKLIDVVVGAARQFKSDFVSIVSGFRHPKYNLILRKKGRQVARDSQHTHGNAVDFAVPGATTKQLEAWAKTQKLGGVGIYLNSGFVHMDTGPIRFWSGD